MASKGVVADFPSKFRAAASTVLERIGLASFAGLTHGGRRDLWAACGYDRTLLLRQYRERYNRGDVASRIIEAFPDATWRGTGEDFVFDSDDPEVATPFEQAWNRLNTRLKVWSVFRRADVLAGLGHYSVILIGAPGNYNEPLPTNLGERGVIFLQPFCQEDAPITRYVEDTSDPRYGEPLEYTLRRTAVLRRGNEFTRVPLGEQLSRQVHWTRTIHVADGALDDTVFGLPRLERVWNRLDDLDKVVGGGSEAFWLRVHRGFQLNADPEIEFEPAETQALNAQVEEFLHGMSRFIKTRGVDMKEFGSDVDKFDTNVASLIGLVSAATKIPQRILLGSERGQLASEQDDHNWASRVQDRRVAFAEPVIVRPFIERLVKHGVLPAPVMKTQAEAKRAAHFRSSATPIPFSQLAKSQQRDRQPAATKPDPTLATPLVRAEDAKALDSTAILFSCYWPEVLDAPMTVRLDQAVKAKTLGPSVITDDEIRDQFVGLPPMTEEQKAEVTAAKQAEQDAEIAKIKARGPSPFDESAGTDEPMSSESDKAKKRAALLVAEESEHSDLFVYLKVDADAAEKLALDGEGAEPKEAMHITVAYCDGDFDKAVSALGGIAQQSPMLHGRVNGIGTFAPSVQSDGRTVLWAYPEVDGLDELHEKVLSALSVVGIHPRTPREYRPHITLAYVDPKAEIALPLVPAVPLYFSQLCVSQGDKKEEFWFGGTPESVPAAVHSSAY